MSKNVALKVSSIIFALVAISHLLRLILKIDITVSGQSIPMGASILGFIFAAILSIWTYKSSKAN